MSGPEKSVLSVESIDRLVPDARQGLPDDVFYLVSRLTPLINVDLLISDEENRKLLTWRHDRFYGPGWHIPGGIIRFKETAADRIRKVAANELTTKVEHESVPVAIEEIMNHERDVRGHFISLVYRCKLIGALDSSKRAENLRAAENGQWIWASEMPENMIRQQRRFERLF